MSKKTKLTFDGTNSNVLYCFLRVFTLLAELYDLLCNNELTDFDPVAEAFQVMK